MVSADNLNLDVLDCIFAYFSDSKNDLVSIALVSRSFLAAVIPRLYATLYIRVKQAIRYPALMSPFAVIRRHPSIAHHVRHVDIRFLPRLKGQSSPHPTFIRECIQALDMCKNLITFTCTVESVPLFLLFLQNKARLQNIRVYSNLTTDQTKKLVDIKSLHSLALDNASWSVMDRLPTWTSSMQQTLSVMTIHLSRELNEIILKSTLEALPQLLGLHIIGCPQIDHVTLLHAISKNTQLESLSLTVSEHDCPLPAPPASLRHLRHLAVDTQYTLVPSPAPTILSSVLAYVNTSSPALSSFTIKLSDSQVVVGHAFIQQLLDRHSLTLRSLAFVNCAIATDSVKLICRTCTRLERLEVVIPTREYIPFTKALTKSFTLHTLVGLGDSHLSHTHQPSLTPDKVRHMMGNVRCLRTIIENGRIWTGQRGLDKELVVDLQRRQTQFPNSYWFTPREQTSFLG